MDRNEPMNLYKLYDKYIGLKNIYDRNLKVYEEERKSTIRLQSEVAILTR